MARDPAKNTPGLVIKRHNIRIWCHDCDMARLQRVVWEGHGARLLSEVSNQPIVKRFLEAVPYIMNTVRDIHQAVVQNDLESVMKNSSDPVPPQILSSRDSNNMTVMHKAAGLGHSSILKYLVERYPQGINDVDNEGRTPLHYAASMRDEQHTYNLLVGLGADESIVDNKHKTPAYYINRPQEIDKTLFRNVPDAPRTASSAYPSTWDWKLLDNDVIAELNKKSRRRNLKASTENLLSKNYTNTISDSTDNRNDVMKASSTHEFISDLPDLDDGSKENKDEEENKQDLDTNKESEENGENNDNEDNKVQENVDNEENEQIVERGENENKHDDEEKQNIEEHHDDKENEVATENHNAEENNESVDTHHSEDIIKNQSYERKEEKDEKEVVTQTGDGKQESKENTVEENDKDPAAKYNEETTSKNTEPTKENIEGNIANNQKTTDITEPNNESINDSNVGKIEYSSENTSNITENSERIPENSEHVADNTEHIITDNIEIKTENIQHNITEHTEPNTQQSLHITDNTKHITENVDNAELDNAQSQIKESTENNKENSSKDENEKIESAPERPRTVTKRVPDAEEPNENNNTQRSEDTKSGHVINGRNTQESLIEGIISGEAEQDSQDASITEGKESVQREVLIVDNEIDPEVSDLINNANMEMLATLVLNGEGARLIGRSSRNTELQAFLDNVPIYMQKINKVHLAAKEGNIRDLQAALDRRKFAIARDPISPNGATPLHVATVFGKTNIIKYLGGRFPETLSAVDFEGRTALHYAAVLPDNGHYYTLLQQLGANSKDLDDNGRSAEDFFKNPSLLPFDQLLSDFGLSEEAVKSMFSDKVPEDQVSSRRSLEASEALETLERCYRLLASAKPSRTPLSASSNRTTPPLVLGRFLKRPIFELIKHRITKLDHDLFDVIWPAVKKLPDSRNIVQTVEEDFPGGISAPDYYVYDVFHEFLIPLIKDIHNINVHSDLIIHPQSDFVKTTSAKLSSEPFVELNIDPNNEFVLSGTIECSRNLEGFELPLNLKVGKLETIERIMTTILMQQDFAKFSEHSNPESDQKGGLYYTLNEVLEKPSEICATLASNGLLIALCDREEIDDSTRLHGKHWPYGRGVFVSEDKTVAIWINVHDHIRVLVSTSVESPGEIGLPFSKLSYIMTYLHEKLDFVWHEKLGHLSSRPTFLGTGLRISLVVNFPGLSKDPDNMKHLCAMRGLQYRETLSPDIARISNYQCLSITETNCFNDFATASSNLLHLERDLSMQNSAHIATMLSNIFRRKRSSIIDIEAVEKPENNN
ncbi:interaptin isoform X4 [Manduca sexta]|uniref:interaptin isoform X4 n=1 Tax=Manduca sexta TaxID=7130 RepID=UPI0011843395|nr:interaptin isoform X4 [Manduca sexta]